MTMGILEGRLGLVTGGAGGLGSVAVRTLLDMGADEVLVVGRTLASLEAIRATAPERISIHAMDVADREAWPAIADRRVDVLIPAAGTSFRVPFLEATFDMWDSMLQTNVVGTMLAARTFLPGMIERGWGRLILISSSATAAALPGRAIYAGTKAALEAWARVIATEVGGTGVLVNCVAPGMFPTDLTRAWLAANPDAAEAIRVSIPERRFGDPEELATAFRFLVETTYAQGSVLRIDGGWTIT
jgi:NAD(P)-dependent dehydrogenase (short-subunit alcohol dehydrogenase family)